MLDEGDKLVPGLSRARVLRAWAGVRPLYQEGYQGESRDVTRALTLLDHRQRDGVAGLLTITGGKWTTFRLMAETTVDKACEQLGVQRPCRTAETPVPAVDQGHFWLGQRLRQVEKHRLQSELICECELVTRAMLEHAAQHNPTFTLDDLRRDVRLGMGPCQGGFCTYRAVGVLHEIGEIREIGEIEGGDAGPTVASWALTQEQFADRSEKVPQSPNPPISQSLNLSISQSPNLLLRDFLQERWKGLLPILWGQQLKQERLDELIYLSLLNTDHLPTDGEAGPMSAFYEFDPATLE